jgi:hypothetical protein
MDYALLGTLLGDAEGIVGTPKLIHPAVLSPFRSLTRTPTGEFGVGLQGSI